MRCPICRLCANLGGQRATFTTAELGQQYINSGQATWPEFGQTWSAFGRSWPRIHESWPTMRPPRAATRSWPKSDCVPKMCAGLTMLDQHHIHKRGLKAWRVVVVERGAMVDVAMWRMANSPRWSSSRRPHSAPWLSSASRKLFFEERCRIEVDTGQHRPGGLGPRGAGRRVHVERATEKTCPTGKSSRPPI